VGQASQPAWDPPRLVTTIREFSPRRLSHHLGGASGRPWCFSVASIPRITNASSQVRPRIVGQRRPPRSHTPLFQASLWFCGRLPAGTVQRRRTRRSQVGIHLLLAGSRKENPKRSPASTGAGRVSINLRTRRCSQHCGTPWDVPAKFFWPLPAVPGPGEVRAARSPHRRPRWTRVRAGAANKKLATFKWRARHTGLPEAAAVLLPRRCRNSSEPPGPSGRSSLTNRKLAPPGQRRDGIKTQQEAKEKGPLNGSCLKAWPLGSTKS